MKLLTLGNTKTTKGEAQGYLTFILHLAPSTLSGYNTCPSASAGCASACLNTAGRGRFTRTQEARIRKTRFFFEHRSVFMKQLVKDVEAAIRKAGREGMTPVFRLNGTSDIRWETVPVEGFRNIMEKFPQVQFYDYTKIYKRALKWLNGEYPKNYHLTYSLNEDNKKEAFDILNKGGNISAVFRNKKLPKIYNGFKVINADLSDLRFKDKKNSIAGLYAKGKARYDNSGFVLDI